MSKGAYEKAVEYIVSKDIEQKTKFLQEAIEGKRPETKGWTGQQWGEFIFGDLQDFADKFRDDENKD